MFSYEDAVRLPGLNGARPRRAVGRRRRRNPPSAADARFNSKADFRASHGLRQPDRQAAYAAMNASRLRRERKELGGSADAHLSTSWKFWKLREIAWAMDRDDAIPGRFINRALDNLLPLTLDPQTGDAVLDAWLRNRWVEWGEDPTQCDVAQKHTWKQLERLILRTMWVGGDCPVIPAYDLGAVQAVEPDRLASPDSAESDIVHGVEVDPFTGRRKRYFFLRQRQSGAGRGRLLHLMPSLPTQMTEDYYVIKDAVDGLGRPGVLLIHDPQRVSETRGVTIYHGAFDLMGMFEDTMFAELQKQQTASCIPVFITSGTDVRLGDRNNDLEGEDDGVTETVEQLVPGTVPRLAVGESIQGIANSGPGANFDSYMRYQLRFIALQLGLPYTLLMLDTTNTTFHGYRGEFEQAKLTFEWIRDWYPTHLHKQVWRHMLVPMWAGNEPSTTVIGRKIAAARNRGTLDRCRVQGRAFPYVNPLQDAQADALRLQTEVASPRQVAAERGRDREELDREIVQDKASRILIAAEEAETLSKKLGEEITWRDLLGGTSTPTPLQTTGAPSEQEAPPPADDDEEPSEDDADESDESEDEDKG